jgi:hypothetical protein
VRGTYLTCNDQGEDLSEMKEAIIAGLISGLLSPLFLSWLHHRLIWKTQKRFEIKFNIDNFWTT